jgi:chromatin segregation and condensation protein Rec8/ScpA/Scc1 (kleisin family)
MLNVTPMVARNAAQCIAAVWILRMSTHQPSQKDYRVRLEAFEGPLDLLLFLVRRAEVDLQDIPIAEITDQSLDARKHEFAMRFPVSTSVDQDAIPRLQDGLELDDVHVMDLADAYERIASSIDFARLGDHVVELDDTPIALYEQDLVDQLGRRTGRSLTLQDAFAGREPIQRVGMFLAVLELIRQFRVRFEQDGDGPIALVLQDEIDQED